MSESEPLQLPLAILGGRDHRSTRLPESGRDKHLLHGYKTLDVRIGGRPLIAVLLERLRATGRFDPIYLVGPASLYEPLNLGVRLIDSDGNFGDNLKATVDGFRADCPEGGHLAVITSDILPDLTDLQYALEDIEAHWPCDYWMPQVPVPEDPERLGESAWKPKYRLRPTPPPGKLPPEPVRVLPGHLLVVHVKGSRRGLVFPLLDLFYRTRNQPIAVRRRAAVLGLLRTMLWYDLRNLFHLRLPSTTVSMLYHGLILASKLKNGIDQQEGAERLRKLFFTRRHRRLHPHHHARIAIIDVLSLAKDIDTEEEAREVAARLERVEGEPP